MSSSPHAYNLWLYFHSYACDVYLPGSFSSPRCLLYETFQGLIAAVMAFTRLPSRSRSPGVLAITAMRARCMSGRLVSRDILESTVTTIYYYSQGFNTDISRNASYLWPVREKNDYGRTSVRFCNMRKSVGWVPDSALDQNLYSCVICTIIK